MARAETPGPNELPLSTETAAEAKIRRFLTDNFPYVDGETVDRDQSLVEAGVIDSTGVLQLVSYVEEEFSLQIPLEDLVPENFDSIANVTRYVTAKSGADAT